MKKVNYVDQKILWKDIKFVISAESTTKVECDGATLYGEWEVAITTLE
jgi:hypothetical protein